MFNVHRDFTSDEFSTSSVVWSMLPEVSRPHSAYNRFKYNTRHAESIDQFHSMYLPGHAEVCAAPLTRHYILPNDSWSPCYADVFMWAAPTRLFPSFLHKPHVPLVLWCSTDVLATVCLCNGSLSSAPSLVLPIYMCKVGIAEWPYHCSVCLPTLSVGCKGMILADIAIKCLALGAAR